MKISLSICMFLMTTICFSQSVRKYYDELYKAGGLDRLTSQYVCFDEDPELQTFFTVVDSRLMQSFLERDKQVGPLARRGFVMLHQYDRGVSIGPKDLYKKAGDSYLSDEYMLSKRTPLRIRLSFSWETLRYKRSVEILNMDHSLRSVQSRYGQCEEVPDGVTQTAD